MDIEEKNFSLGVWKSTDFDNGGTGVTNTFYLSIKNWNYYNEIEKALTIPEGIEAIDPFAFINCDKIEKLYFPSTLKTIGGSAFQSCINLKEVYFKNPVYIGDYAFKDCISLEKIEIIKTPKFKTCSVVAAEKVNKLPFLYFNDDKESIQYKKYGRASFENCPKLKFDFAEEK